jgi:hypothetical protein
MTMTVSMGQQGKGKGEMMEDNILTPCRHITTTRRSQLVFFFFHIILLMQSFRYLFDIMRKLVDSRGVSMECHVSYILSFGPFVFETN